MNKFIFKFFMLMAVMVCGLSFTSCDKDDDEEYVAGESAEDYKPNYYQTSAVFDLSGVSGISAAEKATLKESLENACKSNTLFQTRAEAVAAFDELVAELADQSDFPAELRGMKATIKLTRGSAVIKTAKLTW